jgi:hypothetical protein
MIVKEDSTIDNIIKDHYQRKGSEYLENSGGLWGIAKELDPGIQKKLFKTLDLTEDEIEEMKEEFEE